MDFTPCQQNFWDNDGDPLFDTSSVESNLNLQIYEDLPIADLDFHNDKDEEKLDDCCVGNHDEILHMEVSTMVNPCQACDHQEENFEQDIQHLESESNFKLSDPLLFEPKFDKPLDKQEFDSTIFSQQALIDTRAINLDGCVQSFEEDYTLKVTHGNNFKPSRGDQ